MPTEDPNGFEPDDPLSTVLRFNNDTTLMQFDGLKAIGGGLLLDVSEFTTSDFDALARFLGDHPARILAMACAPNPCKPDKAPEEAPSDGQEEGPPDSQDEAPADGEDAPSP